MISLPGNDNNFLENGQLPEQLLSLLPDGLSLSAALFLLGASFISSAISATFGLGGGVAMLVALLAVTTPQIAIPVHAVIQTGSNSGRAWMLRQHLMKPLLPWFVIGSIAGVSLAASVITALPVNLLQLILALFILWSVWGPALRARPLPEPAFLGVGLLSSFCTMFLGATGPILAAFLNPERYGRDRTVATHAACMSLQHLLKIAAFSFIGFAFARWIPALLLILLAGWFGTLAGGSLLRRVPERTFRLLFKLVLSALALRLLMSALSIPLGLSGQSVSPG